MSNELIESCLFVLQATQENSPSKLDWVLFAAAATTTNTTTAALSYSNAGATKECKTRQRHPSLRLSSHFYRQNELKLRYNRLQHYLVCVCDVSEANLTSSLYTERSIYSLSLSLLCIHFLCESVGEREREEKKVLLI